MKQQGKNPTHAPFQSQLLWSLGAAVLVLLLLPATAFSQFGLDPCCAIVSAGLNSIAGLLKSVVARPLEDLQQLRQQALAFEQQVVYPASAIAQARSLASQSQSQFSQIRQLSQVPVQSATLSDTRQLEQQILSRNVAAIPQINANYAAVFGPVMTDTSAAQPIRDLVDSADAEAQAALKKSVEIDALADLELQAAEQMNRELENAAPGTAPMLEAQASAWLVRANAYLQIATAELIRVRSIDLANRAAQMKVSTAHSLSLRTKTNQLLETPR